MVYHGPIESATQYFNRLNYNLPQEESVADWLIEISSGRLEPKCQVASCAKRNLFKSLMAGTSEEMNSNESGQQGTTVEQTEQTIPEGDGDEDTI